MNFQRFKSKNAHHQLSSSFSITNVLPHIGGRTKVFYYLMVIELAVIINLCKLVFQQGDGIVLSVQRVTLRETCRQSQPRRSLHNNDLLRQQRLGRQGIYLVMII
jgi:hypothetical protein